MSTGREATRGLGALEMNKAHCELLGTTMLVSLSYFSSHSLIKFLRLSAQLRVGGEVAHFGTATSNVSRNSEFSTKSSFFTTSSSDRCERLPLRISPHPQLKHELQPHILFRCKVVKEPLASE